MPARLARSSVAAAAGSKKERNKTRKRNLDAYAIASHSAADKPRLRQHRLGEFLDDGSRQKRRRAGEDEDGEGSVEEGIPPKRRKAVDEDEDREEGSDSEGNLWTLGALAEDDGDSELDSDEAFGESDEEKFVGFTFRGSSGGKKGKKGKKAIIPKQRRDVEEEEDDVGVIDLDEADSESEDEEEDDFGNEGVDLATMLDDENDRVLGGKDAMARDMGEESVSDDEDVQSESVSSSSGEEEEDDDDDDEDDDGAEEERVARMRDRLEALDANQRPTTKKPSSIATAQPSLSVDDLLADLDPAARKQFSAALKTKRKSERPTTLPAPLPKRRQDRIDRQIASKKAKEQLNRWRDTVIHNRRAEFLSFPIQDPDAAEPVGKDVFVQSAPQNELERSIQRIVEESGMASKDSTKSDDVEEAAIMKSEDLATNNLPVEEVLRRRAELRRERELLFREEIKAKRIAKIKSKSYRRVHRKERERMHQLEAEQGLDDGGDEKERHDRRRAEERMGTKHKNSKWARSLRATDRGMWDAGAREGVIEQARRTEELRRRIAGEEIEGLEGSDVPSDDDGDVEDGDDDSGMLRSLDRFSKDHSGGGEGKGLSGMKFMRAAEERQRKRNDEDIERLRREMAVEDGDEEEGEGDEVQDQGLGRANFGPKGRERTGVTEKVAMRRAEMEEGHLPEDESERDGETEGTDIVANEKPQQPKGILKETSGAGRPLSKGLGPDRRYQRAKTSSGEREDPPAPTSTWLSAPIEKKSKRDRGRDRQMKDDAVIDTMTVAGIPEQRPKIERRAPDALGAEDVRKKAAAESDAGNTDGWTLVTAKNNIPAGETEAHSDSDGEEPGNAILSAAEQKAAFHRRAFAGDDVALKKSFDAEKAAAAESEDEQEISTHLPGWGSWTGAGLSKSIKRSNAYNKKHNPLFKAKLPGGVKEADRKDVKLENVIISEKKADQRKKGKKYLAPVLPLGYETQAQYEKALRVPVGPEWTTKEVFQRGTRPRVLVKPGVVVGAMEKPLL